MSIKTYFRLLFSEKKQHLFNIVGLTVSFTVMLIVGLYLNTEYSYDNHIENSENKYRLVNQVSGEYYTIFSFLSIEKATSKLPSIKKLCIVDNETDNIKVGEKSYKVDAVLVSDSAFIDYFDLQILTGTKHALLNRPNTCILSESSASLMFGSYQKAIGQIISLDYFKSIEVVAVYKDLPAATHRKAAMVLSRETWRTVDSQIGYFTEYNQAGSNVYVELFDNSNKEEVENKITEAFLTTHPDYKQIAKAIEDGVIEFSQNLQALENIHLNSNQFSWDNNIVKNSRTTLSAFFVVAFMLLLLALLNYINLSTASSQQKNKLIGVQRILGATKRTIVSFFMIQTIAIVLLSFFLSLIAAYLLFPWFNSLTNSYLQFSSLFQPDLILLFTSVLISIVVFSGVYPSIYYASFSPVVHSQRVQRTNAVPVRSILVTIQFAVSIFLFVVLFAVQKQLTFLTSESLGFDKEQTVQLEHYGDEASYEYFVNSLSNIAAIKSITAASNMPCEYINNQGEISLVGVDSENRFEGSIVGVLPNYFSTLETKILEGIDFSQYSSSNQDVALVNQTAIKKLGIEDPVGKQIEIMGSTYSIIGVVEDVQYRTLHEPSIPICYTPNYNKYRKIAIRLHAGNQVQTLNQIQEVWKNRYPNKSFQITYFDQKIRSNYSTELSQLTLFNVLVAIALLILAIGLLGLISSITEKRVKEIGVRKVNGAKVIEILVLLNKEFVIGSVIAFIIACPIAYYAMGRWLENFAYQTNLSWWFFVLGGVASLSIALITVSWQSWRAATRNPVEALRSE